MSLVRVGLAETKNFAAGYDAIFGTAKTTDKKQPARAAKKKSEKKKAKKKQR